MLIREGYAFEPFYSLPNLCYLGVNPRLFTLHYRLPRTRRPGTSSGSCRTTASPRTCLCQGPTFWCYLIRGSFWRAFKLGGLSVSGEELLTQSRLHKSRYREWFYFGWLAFLYRAQYFITICKLCHSSSRLMSDKAISFQIRYHRAIGAFALAGVRVHLHRGPAPDSRSLPDFFSLVTLSLAS